MPPPISRQKGIPAAPDLRDRALLILDDDASCVPLGKGLQSFGALVECAATVDDARRIVMTGRTDALIAAIGLLDEKGADLIEDFRTSSPGGLLFVIVDAGSNWTGLDSARLDVDEVLRRPVDAGQLAAMLAQRRRGPTAHSAALATVDPLISQWRPYFQFRSPAMRRALENLPRIASSHQPLLITGETGTGKEIISRAVHVLSPRSGGPFVAVNCGAIPETLIEGELFGHEKGAFTGAERMKKGRFESAHMGTLLLDEIGDMPLHLQVRFLRVLEERHLYRVGSEKPIPVNVRVLAATRRDLSKSVEEGLFREDLYYRLNVLRLHLPPLRERVEDISYLAVHFLGRALSEINAEAPYPILSQETIRLLEHLPWRGNVRELRNLMTRVATLLPPGTFQIMPAHVLPHLEEREQAYPAVCPAGPLTEGVHVPFGTPLSEIEDIFIRTTLEQTGGNRTKAAKLLGISIRTLRRKLNSMKDPK